MVESLSAVVFVSLGLMFGVLFAGLYWSSKCDQLNQEIRDLEKESSDYRVALLRMRLTAQSTLDGEETP